MVKPTSSSSAAGSSAWDNANVQDPETSGPPSGPTSPTSPAWPVSPRLGMKNAKMPPRQMSLPLRGTSSTGATSPLQSPTSQGSADDLGSIASPQWESFGDEAARRSMALRLNPTAFADICSTFPLPCFPKPETPHLSAIQRLGDQAKELRAIIPLKSKSLNSESNRKWNDFKTSLFLDFDKAISVLHPQGVRYDRLPQQLRVVSDAAQKSLDSLNGRRAGAPATAERTTNPKERAIASGLNESIFHSFNNMMEEFSGESGDSKKYNELFDRIGALQAKRWSDPENAPAVDREIAGLFEKEGHMVWERLALLQSLYEARPSLPEGAKGVPSVDTLFQKAVSTANNMISMSFAYGLDAKAAQKTSRKQMEKAMHLASELQFAKEVDLRSEFQNLTLMVGSKWNMLVNETFHTTRSRVARRQAAETMSPILHEASESLDELLAFVSQCHVPEDQVESQRTFYKMVQDWKLKADVCAQISDDYLRYGPVPTAKEVAEEGDVTWMETPQGFQPVAGRKKPVRADAPATSAPVAQEVPAPEASAPLARPVETAPTDAAGEAPLEPTPAPPSTRLDMGRFEEPGYREAWLAGKHASVERLLNAPAKPGSEDVAGLRDINRAAWSSVATARNSFDSYKTKALTSSRYKAIREELALCMHAVDDMEALVEALDRHDREFSGADRGRTLSGIRECLGRATALEAALRRPAVRVPSMKNVDELGLEPRMVEAKRLKDGSVELFMTYTHPEADGREWAKRQGLDPSILKSANAHLDRWSLHVHLPEDKFPSEAYVDLDRLALEDLGFASFLAESFEGLSEGDVEDRNIGRGQFDEDSRHRIPPRWIIDQVQRFQASERSSSPSRVRPGARATTF